LVAVGTAFAVVGAAVIVGVLLPGDGPTVTRTSSAAADGMAGGSWRPFVLPAYASDPASVLVQWYATTGLLDLPAQVNVSLYAGRICPPAIEPCAVLPALAVWNGSGPGHWSASGTTGSMYMLFVTCLGGSGVSVNFTATLVEQYPVSARPLPMLPFAITIVGGGLLVGVGAVGLYLGLFLPEGVYAPLDPVGPADAGPGPHDAGAGTPKPPGPGAPGRPGY
jgi:hypothetical protein